MSSFEDIVESLVSPYSLYDAWQNITSRGHGNRLKLNNIQIITFTQAYTFISNTLYIFHLYWKPNL